MLRRRFWPFPFILGILTALALLAEGPRFFPRPAEAEAGTFVSDAGTILPGPKVDTHALPVGADPNSFLRADDYNQVTGACYDLRTAVLALQTATTIDAIHAPSLLNNWTNFGSSYRNAGYWRDTSGTVHLQGVVNNTVGNAGGVGNPLFMLPVGYRPSGKVAGYDPVSPRRLEVDPTGAVYVIGTVSNPTTVSLELIHFRAE